MASTLRELTEMQHTFDSRHSSRGRLWSQGIDKDNLSVLLELTVALAGEVGEFANLAKKLVRGDLELDAARPDLGSELADVFIYLVKLGEQLGLDLEAEFRAKLVVNESRFKRFALD